MAKRINVKLIMELSAGGLTQNEIANSRHFSKTSVSLVLKTAKKLNVTTADLQEMTPEEAYRLFFPEKLSADQIYELPDYEYVHEELKRVGVTLKLLWVRFAPPSGHRCVCQRTLGGDNGQHFNQSLCVQS